MQDFSEAMPDEIHPSGRECIRGWLHDAQWALDAGNTVEAARLVRLVNEKAALELGWFADDMGIAADVAAEVTRLAAQGDIAGATALLRREEANVAA